MLVNVRRSVWVQVLVHTRGEMSACFANVTSITACTRKFVHNVRTEPVRERIFHVEQVPNLKGGINKFYFKGFAESIDKLAHPLLCNTWKMPDVGDLEIVLGHLLFLDTCWRSCVPVLPFLDVLSNNKSPQFHVTTVYRKKTFMGLLANFLSFTPLCYKNGAG